MQKYKVFLNEKSIIFRSSGKITLTKPKTHTLGFAQISEFKLWLDEFEKGSENERIFESDNPAEDFHQFRNTLLNLDAAGGIVQKDSSLLFIFRNDKWDLPKGKIDDGETPEEAALREVEEECGIHGHRITGTLNPTYHIYRSPYKKTFGEWIIKKTHWFEMEYNGTEPGTPERDEGITEIRWVLPVELDLVLENTYENLKELISNFRRG